MKESEGDIAQRLAAERAKATGEPPPLDSGADMLSGLRAKGAWPTESGKPWLRLVMALLINAGHKLFTRFAFCPDGNGDRLSPEGKTQPKGGIKNVKTAYDTG